MFGGAGYADRSDALQFGPWYALHEICSFYQVEVFDLHLQGTFGKLNYDNHWQLLYDGIHLHDIGASDMIDVFSAYLTDLDS